MKQIFFDNEKLWQITIEGTSFTTAYGKIHNDSLKEATKSFDSEEKTNKEAEKLIAKKVKSGYQKLRLILAGMHVSALAQLQEAQDKHSTTFDIYADCTADFIEEICKIETLTNLRMTIVDHLPATIGQLKKLERLRIKGKNLKFIPDEISGLSNLKRLSIDKAEALLSIPNTIGTLSQLTKLTINHTSISRLPDSIGQLKQLEELDISHNPQLRYLPASIGQLKALKELEIDRLYEKYSTPPNTIPIVIPEEIGLLSNLEELSLASNNLSTLPDSIGQLKNLKELSLASNNLHTLPDSIGQLTNLKELSLDYNHFKEIPTAIFQLSNLEELSLRNSPLVQIPLQFCLLKKLVDFDFYGHDAKIPNVPSAILDDGVQAIQEYLIKNTDIEKVAETDRLLLTELRKQQVAKVLEMPPPPSNKETLLLARKEQLETFQRSVNDRADSTTTKRLNELTLYLKGLSATVPTAHVDDDDYFGIICSALNPVQDWNFIDHRILAFICQSAFYYQKRKYYSGYHEAFAKYIETQIQENPQQHSLYLDIVHTVALYGLDELTLLTGVFDELRYLPLLKENQSLTSFGQYLLDYFEQKPDELIALIVKHKHLTRFAELMVLHNEAGLKPYLPQLIVITEYEGYDGNKHIPFKTLDVLCTNNPIYKEYILDLLSKTDCISCAMECYRILYTNFKEEYAVVTLEKIKEILAYISTKKNEGNSYHFNWSLVDSRWKDNTASFINWACTLFGEALKQTLFEYVENTKDIALEAIKVAVQHYGQNAIDIAGEALHMTIDDNSIAEHYKTTFSILADLDYSKYYDKVWEIAQSKYTEVANTACVALSQQDAKVIIPSATKRLSAKSIPARRAGVFTLALINTADTHALIKPLLATEKKEEIRNIIVQVFMETPSPISLAEAQARVVNAAARGKLTKPITKWLDESTLPTLYWRNQSPLTTEEVRFLFYRQKSIDSIELDFEAREVFGLIDPKTSGAFANALWSLMQKNGGAKAKNRFAMAVIGALGDNNLIEPLYMESTSGKNLNTCMMLGLMKTLEAARALDRVMQFFKLMYPNVRGAAERAFESIANSMQLSSFELSDKMLPDLGFQNLEQKVQVGTDIYTAFITSNLKFAYKSPKGKVIKSLSKADKSVKEELKKLDQTLKNSVKQFAPNLEFYLVTQRAWTATEWSAFFLGNPIAFAAAQNFVWQLYDANNVAIGTFMVTSKQVLLDHQEQAITLDKDTRIRFAHPILMETKELVDWKTYTNQQKIKPPFPQLDRPVILAVPSIQAKTMDYQYRNFELNGDHFKSRATKKGWKRGAVVDSGEISSYQKPYPTLGIQAIIKTSNLNVQSYDDDDVTLHEFYFVQLGSVEQGSYTYDEPRDESDSRLILFGKVPPIVYSETIADLQAITAN